MKKKPGRKATGRLRKKVIQTNMTEEEHEYIMRYCFNMGVSANWLIRNKIFPVEWYVSLKRLRREQRERFKYGKHNY